MCGGSLEVNANETVATCAYCGTQQTLPKTDDDVISNLFNRANNLRLKCEFDKAAQIYEKIVEQDDSEAEAHWGIVLCKYGIEYVEDPKTGKRIPTCHRTLFEAVTTDTDYLAAIDYSDAAQQRIYESEARAIDRIQKDILAIVKNEKPFDVFICYKETDANGKRTIDSSIANDIYYQLTQEGFKVFFAAITLEDKLGQEYEPYIFAALNSAKVMLVLGTKPEYFSAVWVKNEWSRFLQLMKTDRSKLLIPCYRDMDAYDLPEEFAHLQAQDMGKIGFINDVVRGIKKLTPEKAPQATVIKETVVATEQTNSNIAALLKRGFLALEDGEWQRADDFFEQALNQDAELAEAYLGKLMAELQVKKQEDLKDCAEPFDGNSNYQKVVRFGDESLKTVLVGYVEHINVRNENARLQKKYDQAKRLLETAKTRPAFFEAARQFETISNYLDAAALAKACYEGAEAEQKNSIYENACGLVARAEKWSSLINKISAYDSAKEKFLRLDGWKDSMEKAEMCAREIEVVKELEAKQKAEEAARAEQLRIEREAQSKRNKRIGIMAACIVYLIVSFVIFLFVIIIPNGKYNDAIALMDEGNLDEAYGIFTELGNYKDAADKAGDIRLTKFKEQLKGIKVGNYIKFGAYEQDNNTSNGKEDVEWLVLEVKDGKALVISKYALDCKPYNASYTDVTWETCTLRKWLNNDFLGSAFSANEKAMIPTVTVSADKNPDYSTNPGNATQDQVFLLSITEVNKYFSSDSARQCKPTDYAVAGGAYVNSSNGNCWWWLRSPGYLQDGAAYMSRDGYVYEVGDDVNTDNNAVRPALWIDLSKI